VDCLHRIELRLRQAPGFDARRAGQLRRIKDSFAAAIVADDAVGEPIELVACGDHRIVDKLYLVRANPAVTELCHARARAGGLKADPVDDRYATEDAVEVAGETLGHGEPLAAAFGQTDIVELCWRAAVPPLHQHHRHVAHLLVGGIGEVRERLVIEGKGLQRNAGGVLVAGIGPVGGEAARERRGMVRRRQRRQPKTGDERAIEPAAPELHGRSVPLRGKVHLEADRRGLRVDRCDSTDHFAIFRGGGDDGEKRRERLERELGQGQRRRLFKLGRFDGSAPARQTDVGGGDRFLQPRACLAGRFSGAPLRGQDGQYTGQHQQAASPHGILPDRVRGLFPTPGLDDRPEDGVGLS
jgi:hypothetical protein